MSAPISYFVQQIQGYLADISTKPDVIRVNITQEVINGKRYYTYKFILKQDEESVLAIKAREMGLDKLNLDEL
jgi:hypothetical protein